MTGNRFEAITFDCYGTLVDWESGILAAVVPVFVRHGVPTNTTRILEAYARHESRLQGGPYTPYREVLREVMTALAGDAGFDLQGAEREVLADTLAAWPLFPDTAESLRRLATEFRLGILSNIDDELFAGTRRALAVEFEWIVTAEQVGSYKPAASNFSALIARTGLPRAAILHAAQSLFHDIGPATAAGLATAWVNRRAGRDGAGATPPASATPTVEVATLEALADHLGCD